MSMKNDIIAVLRKQEELKEALNEINRQRESICQNIDSCKNDIDLIFAKVQSTNYGLYNQMFIDGRNEVIARFEMDGEIVEVTRDMKYEKPTDRIKIARKPLLV